MGFFGGFEGGKDENCCEDCKRFDGGFWDLLDEF
jgi:hypothetical protein